MSETNWIGRTLGTRYRIKSLLGQGGMSAVYRATDPNLRRTVAIKLVHAHLTGDPEFVRRFESEASTVAQFRHPNIIQVFDFDHDGATYFMVLEFVPGETLHARLRRLAASNQKLPISELLTISVNVAEAIDYAHARGLVHRDIKPANVMINPQGQAVLMDFGIAKIVGSANQTATGTVIGTAQYISPEQVRGQRPSGRSDIYALGVTMFEMAAGQAPFDGDSAMSIMLKHVNEPVPNLRLLNPDTPPDAVAIIERCLAKDPDQRFQTGAELSDALRKVQARLASGAPLHRPPPPTQRPPSMATIMEPMPGGMPAPQASVRSAAPPPQPSVRYTAPPQPAPSMNEPPPPVFNRPSVSAAHPLPKPAAAAAPLQQAPPVERRGPPVGVLIGVPLVLAVCVLLGAGGLFLANSLGLFNEPAATSAAATATQPVAADATATTGLDSPTDVPATPVPTDVPVVAVPDGMTLISGGGFNMGSTTGQPDEQPLHPVKLSAFYIDPLEVTNERYLACLSETVCSPPASPSSFTQPAYFGNPGFAQFPVVSVNWNQAATFCQWDNGKRLPTEAEWEFAATGGDNRRFPWGNDFDPSFVPANAGDTVQVGSFKAGMSPLGVFDMAGNVLEWVNDIYDSVYYAKSVTDNPPGPDFGDGHVLRGGSFGNPDGAAYTTTRRYHLADGASDVDTGFRCAFTAPCSCPPPESKAAE